jgi:hypothetical protein
MKRKNPAVIDSSELIKKLEELGIALSSSRLRDFSKRKLLPAYETTYQHTQMKRGRPKKAKRSKKGKQNVEDRVLQKGRPGLRSKWPAETLELAAALGAVLDLCKKKADDGKIKQKKLSEEGFWVVQEIAKTVFRSPNVIHELPPDFVLTTPNPSHVYSFQDLETKIVQHSLLNELAVKWIAARAKVRNNENARREAQRIKQWEDAQSDVQKRTHRALKDMGAISAPRYIFFKISDPATVIVYWHSELLRIKNPLLKDVPVDEFERTLQKEGVFEEVPPDPLHIPHIFRNVPERLQRQECRIPSDSPTIKEFWDRWDRYKNSWTPNQVLDAINEITKDWRYLPTGWKPKFDRVEIKPSRSDHDELAVFIDGNDSRKKALYAPFSEYNPHDTFGPERLGRFY